MFLLGLILASSVAHGSDYTVKRDWHSNYSTPDIMICKKSNTKKEIVEKSVNFWKSQGFKVGDIVKEKNNECSNEWERGYILIGGQGDLDIRKDNGSTYPFCKKGTEKMVSAFILLNKEKANNLELVKHEIGHGLGLGHTDHWGHVMYAYGKGN